MKTHENTLAYVESRLHDMCDRLASLRHLVDPSDEIYFELLRLETLMRKIAVSFK